ncbi:MAG: peptide chain release factor N(5)-glutamine methyltransferase [Blautia sp.]|nr:peptide chain release factor N(5)-glutamine methyltransferase [Blautia sp.]
MQAGQNGQKIRCRSLLKYGEEALSKAEIPEAGLDAWLLLEYTAGVSRAWYYAHADETVSETVQAAYTELIRKRASRVPLQHLTHQAFFMGHEFYVDERVLVPRQDTEVLVEKALACLADFDKKLTIREIDAAACEADAAARETGPRILDMCTGSGCILLSLLAECRDAVGVGADLSEDALAVAAENAERLSLQERAVFVKSNLFSSDFFLEKDGKTPEKYDMLISNPPYIPTAQIANLMDEVRLHDPRMALDGREDGLYFYREISRQASGFLKPGGRILYEIGYDQGTAVKEILTECGFTEITVEKDLSGLDRVVAGRLQTYV